MGTLRQWRAYAHNWRRTLSSERVNSRGFHASECVRGVGDYRNVDVRDRDAIMDNLVESIRLGAIKGAVAVVDMDRYRQLKAEFVKLLGKNVQKFNNEYLLAFAECVYPSTKLVKHGRIDFTFDQRPKGYLGSTPEFFDDIRTNRRVAYTNRMGKLNWGDRRRDIGLHAADLLAYSAYRHLAVTEIPAWSKLNFASPVITMPIAEEFWGYAFEEAKSISAGP